MATRREETVTKQRPKFQDDPVFMQTLEFIISLRKSKEAVDRFALSMGGEFDSINEIAARIDESERCISTALAELVHFLEKRGKEKQGAVPEANTQRSRSRARSAA
jgi:hypothetical protein